MDACRGGHGELTQHKRNHLLGQTDVKLARSTGRRFAASALTRESNNTHEYRRTKPLIKGGGKYAKDGSRTGGLAHVGAPQGSVCGPRHWLHPGRERLRVIAITSDSPG